MGQMEHEGGNEATQGKPSGSFSDSQGRCDHLAGTKRPKITVRANKSHLIAHLRYNAFEQNITPTSLYYKKVTGLSSSTY